ncbi:NUDIX hydrolase [Adhaeribacter rhizoryzae]|uniref:NUDIX hydrolase n=1 Tax=Adhaeribacter rhizoryzae TaxID=2607907 RepID=A0A5M6D1J4_9BACT|nr:NUDIX hydrolase [Adhaeribacter rhizoryzae]
MNLNAHYSGKLRVRVCGVLIEDKKILLVRHQGITGKYALWSPPGGGLAYGEKVLDCLEREFREETGLAITPKRFLFLREFLNEPLHALELFFEVAILGGTLKTGSDPELSPDDQLIQEVAFKSLAEIRQEKDAIPHQIFEDLIDLDDLFMPQHRFL